MGASFVISDPQITVNDELWDIKGNSASYQNGTGERSVTAAGTGGGKSQLVISENVETKVAGCKFAVPADAVSIDRAEQADKRLNNNVVRISGTDPAGNSIRKVFTNAIIMNNPEYNLKQDGVIELEWASDPVV